MKKHKHVLNENSAPIEGQEGAILYEDIGYILAELKSFNELLAYYNAMTGENLRSEELFDTTKQHEGLEKITTPLKTKNLPKESD